MPIIRELITQWGFDVDDKALDSAEKKLRSVQAVAETAIKVTGAAVAAMVVPAAMIQDKVADALTIAGQSMEELVETEDQLINKTLLMSQDLGIVATEIGASFYDVISAGNEVLSEEFDSLAETGLKMAKVVKMEAGESIESLSDTVNGFGMNMTEASRAADVLFKTSFLAATNVPMLTQAMKEAGPISNTVGKEIEETSAIIAAYAKGGIKGAQAGTAFRSMLVKLSAPNKSAKEGLKALSTTIFGADKKMRKITDIMRDLKAGTEGMTQAQINQNLKMIAGEEGFAKMALLMNSNLDEIDEWEAKLKEAGGALDLAFDIKMNSAYEQGKKFLMGIMNIAAALGKHLLPPLTKVLKALNAMFTGIVKFLINSPLLTKWIAMLTTLTLLISAVVFGIVSWKLAVIGLTAAYKTLGTAAILAQLKMVALVAAAVIGVALIILVLQDLFTFITDSGDSVIGRFVESWSTAWGDNLSTLDYFVKSSGDMIINFVTLIKNLFKGLSTVMKTPFLSLQQVLLSISAFIVDTLMIQIERAARTFNSFLKLFGGGVSNKEIGILFKYINDNTGGKIKEGIYSVNEAREFQAKMYDIGAVYNNSERTVMPQNSQKIEKVEISINDSNTPIETAKVVKGVLSDIVSGTDNDFSNKVVY